MSAPKPLLLVGAGGLAREVLATVRAGASGSGWDSEWVVTGFLDDNPARHGLLIDGLPVLGALDSVADHPYAHVVICTASTRDQGSRKRISERLNLPPERYATIVHPAASAAQGTKFGAGTVVMANVVVTAPQEIGSHVIVMPHVTITHDDEIADFVTFASRVAVSGSVTIGEGTYLGTGSLIREGLKIGAWSLIGMGAVVLEDVPDGQVWVGNPARRLRDTAGPT